MLPRWFSKCWLQYFLVNTWFRPARRQSCHLSHFEFKFLQREKRNGESFREVITQFNNPVKGKIWSIKGPFFKLFGSFFKKQISSISKFQKNNLTLCDPKTNCLNLYQFKTAVWNNDLNIWLCLLSKVIVLNRLNIIEAFVVHFKLLPTM